MNHAKVYSHKIYRGPMRYVLIAAGSLFLGLATMGLFVPILPTTPFLLLSTACYIRSSRRLYQKVMDHPVFGTYLSNYAQRAMRRRDKIITLTVMWIGILISTALISYLWVRVLLIVISCGVTWHLTSLKDLP